MSGDILGQYVNEVTYTSIRSRDAVPQQRLTHWSETSVVSVLRYLGLRRHAFLFLYRTFTELNESEMVGAVSVLLYK